MDRPPATAVMVDRSDFEPLTHHDLFFDEPLNAAEYARQNGLTIDFACDPVASFRNLAQTLAHELTDSDGLTPCGHLPDIAAPAASVIATIEQWDVSGKAPEYLEDACKRWTKSEIKDLVTDFVQCHTSYTKRLKLEPPALRTDHGMDYRAYNRTVTAARETCLLDHHLPLEPTDTEKDEGLEFPASVFRADGEIAKAIAGERFEVTRNTLQCLSDSLELAWTDETRQELLENETNYRGITAKEPLTPPISPRLREREYYVPGDDVCLIPIPSDPSTQLSEDLRAVEDTLFEPDNGPWPADIQLLNDLERSQGQKPIFPPSPRPRIADLKVEVPLMPQDANDGVLPPPVLLRGFHDCTDPTQTELDVTSDVAIHDGELEQTLRGIAAKTLMSIEQEKLQVVDAIARVPVPLMDFSIPVPGWDKFRCDISAMFQWIRDHHWEKFETPRWPANRVVESKMTWMPWTGPTPTPSAGEKIKAADGVVGAFLTRTADADVPNSSDFVWKRPGLAVLRDDEDCDEDELELPISHPLSREEDLMTTIKRKKRLLEDEECEQRAAAKLPTTEKSLRNCPADSMPALLVGDEQGAAFKLLDNYMELYAPKRLKLTHSSFFKSTAEKPTQPIEASAEVAPQKPRASRILSDIPCPDIRLPDSQLRLIISISVPRGVLRRLERLLPGADLIDRDYNAHNLSIWLPGSVCRSEVTSKLADEADLIVSPSTGILLTTMIKIKQKPLPGTKGNSPLYSRIEKVSVRYERLIILVSEGIACEDMETLGISPADANALARFQGFVTSLETQGLVVYIAGGEENLAKWAASMTCRYAADASAQQCLLQWESPWELFLRRAGMNAYAAQVILGMLKDQYIVIDGQRFCGLAAFIKLSDYERGARFAGVLGGTRVIQRVSKVIDRSWDQDSSAGRAAGHVAKEPWL